MRSMPERGNAAVADVIVIGGGAAGLMAAIFAARAGASVTVVERNEKNGRKIYITGKGRCNVTNDCTMDEFMKEVPRNPRFLYSVLSRFSPQDMLQLLEDNGCPTVVQRGRRAYPASEKASDVTACLERICRREGVRFQMNTRIRSLLLEDGVCRGVTLENGREMRADSVIVATGGLSYPGTGSTGDGYRMAQEVGHTIISTRPSLVAVETEEAWPAELQGLSMKNVTILLKNGKKTLYKELGEMLFTHFGVSGPLVLEMSCHLPEEYAGMAFELDLKPALDEGQLHARLLREIEEARGKQLRTLCRTLAPLRLADMLPHLAGIPDETLCAQLTAAQREQLVQTLKHLTFHVKKLRPMDEAIVTRGGVSTKEIMPATMQSKLVGRLYFAGEVIDVDAHTGGYNLQIAFATGALAGESAAGIA